MRQVYLNSRLQNQHTIKNALHKPGLALYRLQNEHTHTHTHKVLFLTECDVFVQGGFEVAGEAVEDRVTAHGELEALIPVVVHI